MTKYPVKRRGKYIRAGIMYFGLLNSIFFSRFIFLQCYCSVILKQPFLQPFLLHPGGADRFLSMLVSSCQMVDVQRKAGYDKAEHDGKEELAVLCSELLDMSGQAVNLGGTGEPASGFHVLLILFPVFRVILIRHLLAENHFLQVSHGISSLSCSSALCPC